MIVPASRLVWLTALVAPPAAGLGFAAGGRPWLAGLLLAALALVVAGDAWFSRRRLNRLRVAPPALVRFVRGRTGLLALRIEHAPANIRIALALPEGLRTDEEARGLIWPAGAEAAALPWPITALRRGRFVIETCGVETTSRLGLWLVRRRLACACEVRVYPDLLAERRAAAAVFLHRGAFGSHARRQVGKGREFQQLREYLPGDSYDDIHWKATARRGAPVSKVWQMERTQEVYVVLDASRLGAQAIGGDADDTTTRLDRHILAALLLAHAAGRQGDRFGLLTFADHLQRFVRAQNARASRRLCHEALYELMPADASPDFREVCSFIRLRLTRRALVVFLTSLDDPALAEDFLQAVELIRRRHLVVVFTLPSPGMQPFLADSHVVRTDADIHGALAGQLTWERLAQVEQALARRGVRCFRPRGETFCSEILETYLDLKRRQLL
jgi:uncharacterized protein (DUF58 family)